MRTPSGAECPHYYEDFARGGSRQECRVPTHPRSVAWLPPDCARCAVPAIRAANGSPHLELRIQIRPGALGLGRRVETDAWCSLHGPITRDPRAGCPVCNEASDALLREALG